VAKTLRELKADPELLAAEFPEIYSALQELQGRLRQMHIALAGRMIPSRLAIPQDKSPALPNRFHDLLAALQGDREAIARTIPVPKKVNSDLWVEAVRDVLSNTGDVLPVYLYRDGRTHPWRDTNGKLKGSTPNNWLIKEVWGWLKVEAINALNCQLHKEPYKPGVLFSEEPSEDNPFPLWLPTNSRGRGRPPGPSKSRSYNEDDFWPAVAEARQKLSEEKHTRIFNKDIAHKMGISEERYYFYRSEYGPQKNISEFLL
jgi:hypothetical protein